MLNLGELPTEILIKILWNVHWKELDQCRRLSRQFSKVIQESQLLQYSLELGRSGYRLRPLSFAHPSLPECVAALHRIEALWKELRFKKLNDEPIPLSYERWENRWSPYVNFIFSSCRQNDEHAFPDALPRGPYDQIDSVDFEELLDGNASIVPKLTSFKFGFGFHDWVHDIQRDLIVLFDNANLALYFMSAHDQKLHPSPKQNPIVLDKPENRHLYESWCIKEVSLTTRSDYMVVQVVRKSNGRSLPSYYLMNWVTGQILKGWVSMKTMRFDSYCTRGDEAGKPYFLVIGFQENPFGGALPFLRIYTFPSTHSQDINLLATFLLPPPAPDVSTDSEDLYFPHSAATRTSSPFESNTALVVVEFSRQIWFITHISTILSPKVTQQNSSGEPLVFPWDTWGPQNVRMIYYHIFGFEASIIGSRILLGDRLLDFDRQRVADALQNSQPDVIDEEDTIDTHTSGSVTTRLPYIEKYVTFPEPSVSLPYVLDTIECMDGLRVMKWYYDETVRSLDIFALY